MKAKPTISDPQLIEALQKAIRDLHGCESVWVRSESVKETFQGKTAWDGTVEVFELKGHPSATLCYAWESPPRGKRKPRLYAVLHQPPVDSPAAAVQAAIIQDLREGHI